MPGPCRTHSRGVSWIYSISFVVVAAACQPTVKVEAPKDPIVINLNVKIEQEVRVKVEKDVEDLLDEEGLF